MASVPWSLNLSRTVIFDFDGTIADTLDMVVAIYRELTGDERHVSKVEIDELRKLPLRQLLKAVDIPLLKVPTLLTRGQKFMRQRVASAPVFPGMPKLLHALVKKGYILHIVSSNTQENVQAFLEKHKLASYFVEVHGSVGLFGKAKVLRSIATRSHVTTRDAWYVGDEARDISAAKKAGIRMAAVTWGYQHVSLLEKLKPTALARTPEELLEIVTK